MMTIKLKVFCAVLSLLLLSSCTYFAQSKERAAQRQVCYAKCEDRCDHCSKVCDQDRVLCNKKADATAAVYFKHYVHQSRVKGRLPTATLKAFRDPLACMQPSCDCVLDRRMCREACDGKIYKILRTVKLDGTAL